MQVSSLLKNKNSENALSIPLLDQDRRQTLGTLLAPPSLTSQEFFDLQALSSTRPQWPEGTSGSLWSSTLSAWISSSAPSPVQSHLSPKDGDPILRWGHWLLLNYLTTFPVPCWAITWSDDETFIKQVLEKQAGRGLCPHGCPLAPAHLWLPLDSWLSMKGSAWGCPQWMYPHCERHKDRNSLWKTIFTITFLRFFTFHPGLSISHM